MILEANKTVFYPIADLNLVRTGTYGDGNCFYHALLRAMDAEYRYKSYDQCLQAVKTLKERVGEHLSEDGVWTSLGQGEQRRLLFMAELVRLFEAETASLIKDLNLERLVSEAQNRTGEARRATSDASTGQNFYTVFMSIVVRKYPHHQALLADYCYKLFLLAHENAISNFRQSLLASGEPTDGIQMEIVARTIQHNIIIIYEATGRVYTTVSVPLAVPTIVLLWVNENHFEVLGEYQEDRSVKRIFTEHDPVLRILCAPHSEVEGTAEPVV